MKKLFFTTMILSIILFGCADTENNSNIPNTTPNTEDNETGGNGDDNSTVNPPEIENDKIPVANFDYDVNGCTVTFTDNSTDDKGITAWEWNFGTSLSTGPIISTEQNPTQDLLNPITDTCDDGTYTVKLTVADEKNQTDIIEEKITVTGLKADFSYTVDGTTVKFKDWSSNNGTGCFLKECKQAVKWEWNFGDDNISYEQNPTHTYENTGTYNVSLIVYTSDNISHTTTQTIVIQ